VLEIMTFLTVNSEEIEIPDARHWSAVADSQPFIEATVERAVLHQYAQSQGFTVSAEEVQRESDRTRFALELSDPTETQHWLKRQHLTNETFAAACAHAVLRNKVRAAISDDKLKAYYDDNPDQFTAVDLYVIRRKNAKKLNQPADQLRAGEGNFHLEAISQSEDPRHRRAWRLLRTRAP